MARLTRRNFSASAIKGDLVLLSTFTLHTKFYMHSRRTCRKKSIKNHNTTQNTTKIPHTSKSAELCPKHAAMIQNVERRLEMMQRVYELAPRILLYPRREGRRETTRVTLPVYLISSTILHLELCRAR